jgi:hypothetical protein
MRKITKKQAAVVAAATVAAVGAGTVGYAYWSTTGSGTGTASTDSGAASLTFAQSQIAAMYPGDAAQSFSVTVTNTAGNSAYVGHVKAYLTVAQANGATGTCSAGDYKLGTTATNVAAAPGTAASAIDLNWTAQELAKTSGHADATGYIQFNDSSTANQDGCKGATVTVNYLAS